MLQILNIKFLSIFINSMVEPNIGMMEGAYFVSKNDILNWLNDLLKV